MLATKRLYYDDSYLTQMTARVIAASDDGLRVTLEETIFYPTSGGQPHDLGTLNGIQVIDVIDDGDSVTHVLAAPLTGTVTEGRISWERRYDHMQQHTGQHLLSAIFEDLFKIPTLSFRMSEQSSSIELGTKALSPQQLETVTLRTTELARTNPRLAVHFEDAAAAQGLRKASEREGILRIVEIPGIDRSACGGTHVASLAEVLPLQIREMEKVRGNVRIVFVCGNRAVARTQADFQALARIAGVLGTSQEKAEEHVLALKQNLAETDKQWQRLKGEAATRAALDLYAATPPGDDGMRHAFCTEVAIDENAREIARVFCSQPKAVLLTHSSDGVLLACSPDSGLNAGAILKGVLAKYGARGGGSANVAQGSFPSFAVVDELKRILRPAKGHGLRDGMVDEPG